MNLSLSLALSVINLGLALIVAIGLATVLRRQRAVDKKLRHLRADADHLMQGEERRALVEARANRAFLSDVSLRSFEVASIASALRPLRWCLIASKC